MTETQCIVIGGGPAGATCATYMAMQGHSVLLVEKEEFPRYRLGESLLPSMMPILEDFGLIEACEEAGFPHKTGGTFVWGADEEPWDVLFSENPFLPYSYGYHVDRARFDELLLDHARQVGVTVKQPARVKDVLREGERVVGVTYTDADGDLHEARARFVIDASGPACVVGRQVAGRAYDDSMRQTSLHAYYRNVLGPTGDEEHRKLHVYITSCPQGWWWWIPMACEELGEVSLGLVTGQEFREDIKRMGKEAFFQKALEDCPRMQRFLGPDAELLGGVRAIQDWAYGCDQLAGPGWFLAGDAAAFLDPLLSTGVSLAMLAGYSASVCMNTILADPGAEQAAIDFYDGNYKRMYTVTRDTLLYFYSGNAQHADDIFWEARRLMKFGENVCAKQAFGFLLNTVAANPHPAVRKQIHMFHQFMAHLDHPLAKLGDEVTADGGADGTVGFDALRDDTVLELNGRLEDSFVIDGEAHRLEPVRGVAYDEDRPVFSSTSSWLLGRNFHAFEGPARDLAELVDGRRTWGEVIGRYAEERGVSTVHARHALTPALCSLASERFVLLRPPVAQAAVA